MAHQILRREFLISGATALAAAVVASICRPALGNAVPAGNEVPTLLDHILLGCSDLDRGIAFVEERTGVRAAFGGVHPGRGTRNALLSLGPSRYLEIMAPDREQKVTPQIARLPELKEPRIVGWAAHVDNIEELATHLREQSIEFEPPRAGSRQRPDGKVLHWKSLTLKDDQGGLLPFFIEWSADSVHPSTDAPQGCQLDSFTAMATDPVGLKKLLDRLGLELPMDRGAKLMLR